MKKTEPNELIINPASGTPTGAVHMTADLMWKF